MADNGIAKVQHYVPQFLLRQFGTGKKDQLHVFDKATGRTFVTNAKNVASESRFYDFQLEEANLTIEPALSKLESTAKPLLEQIVRDGKVTAFTALERADLCAFFAVQFTRTKNYRERFKSMSELLRERVEKMAPSAEAFKEFTKDVPEQNENQLKLITAESVLAAPREFGPLFNVKTWHVLATTAKRPFLIGDNPISMQNMIDMQPYGNLGLAVKGIEIYFPLTPTRALAMWCPSITDQIMQSSEQLRLIRSQAPEMLKQLKDPDGLERLAAALASDTPLDYEPTHIENFNSLQISNAERYVFSNGENFGLVREMLSAHPHLSRGPRMKA
ncbi:hypothetical protein BH11PSE8_BH11PSE8_42960 [soil metagenome]